MVFEVVINHVFVKLSVPSFGISPARTVMGTNASTVAGSKNRKDIVSSFCGANTSASVYLVGIFRGSRCDGDHTPRPGDRQIAERAGCSPLTRLAQVHPDEVRSAEVRLAEVRLAKVRADVDVLVAPHIPVSRPLRKLGHVIVVRH